MRFSTLVCFGFAAVVGTGLLAAAVLQGNAAKPEDRAKLHMEFQNGNFKDAYEGLRALCLDPQHDKRAVVEDIGLAVQCLNQLGRTSEIDAFLESVAEAQKQNWRALAAVAQQYVQVDHMGFMVAGKFERGPHRGGGRVVNSLERDRVRALQLMAQAAPLAKEDDRKNEVADFYLTLARHLLYDRGYEEAWRLQYLSDLSQLPDYDEGYPYFREFNGAPVDENGKPVFHATAKSWEEAKTDGERWRWALEQAVENFPARKNDVRWEIAQFSEHQFGVQTMAQRPWGRPQFLPEDDDKNESGPYALPTLKENETIAKLANGIKRFDLPDDYNHIRIYQQIAEEPKSGRGDEALLALANVFQNRLQFPRAAEYWRKSIEQYGPGPEDFKRKQLEQITGAWGRFEPIGSQPTGGAASFEFRFRNGKKVAFKAHQIKIPELLADVKAYLKSDPQRLDWRKFDLGSLGWRLVHNNEKKYVGAEEASWDLGLDPRENHFDRRITVSTPIKKAGAYLITASMEGGNVSKIVLWVADTAIVRKQLSERSYYFVADAASGKPIKGANLEFFGFQQEHLGGNRYRTNTTNFAEKTDADGQATPDPRDLKPEYQWLVISRGEGGRFAFLGFSNVWSGQYYDAQYNEIKIFPITDRPVYRPGQKVHYKFWVARAQYDNEENSAFANQTFPAEIYDPKGEKVADAVLQTDAYGGAEGEFNLPSDATLGQWQAILIVKDQAGNEYRGGAGFRVEEYKKPEFEVTVEAPDKPVMLGEKITAKINARYYFGSPVLSATVKYKVLRQSHTQDWYPHMPWDWCYGPGYWWFAYDMPWYRGWSNWVGCRRPTPSWWWRGPQAPPELVAEVEAPIGADGTVSVEIDTAVAKELHGDTDHQYTITAEVRDESRRTIVGEGKVLVARKPFRIFTWLDRGYYRAGDTVEANFKAQTLDNKPVQGEGELTLLRVTYDDKRQPVETPVEKWKLNTNEEGLAQQQIKAAAKGQYRLSYKLTDSEKHTIEGGYLFTVIGEGFTGENFRFNAVELIPEKKDYQPGETVKLQVNVDRNDGVVLLFVRPTNGVYLPPKVLRMDGKSTVVDIGVAKKDMPNFFVEAVTVAGGDIHSDVREIVVPPEKRVLNVAVEPSQQEYKPGEKAKVKVRLTDFTGENFVGSTLIAIYDKALEYISGGGNVPDIKEFFWKWRRQHHPQEETNLARMEGNITRPNEPPMSEIGVFGGESVDQLESLEQQAGDKLGAVRGRGEANFFGRGAGGGFGGGAPGAARMLAAESAAPASAALSDSADFAAKAAGAPADGGQQGPAMVQPSVRTNFADTALWVGAVTTDKTGLAEVELTMPENLTTWSIHVWGMGKGTRVGEGKADVVTRKNLIVRLQAPRFFVQKDEVVLSANVHNYLKADKDVAVSLELEGDLLAPLAPTETTVRIAAGGEKRVDWRVKVLEEGQAVVRMKALTDEESDATEIKLPCYVHGMLKTESWAGSIRPDKDVAAVTINVPAERRPAQSLLEVRYSPSLALAMVDALPYLAEYPYGCTEQTLNRFLPTVVTQKVLIQMNLDLAAIRDKRVNLNAQELGDAQDRAKQWKRFDRNPVFEQEELERMVKEGVKELTNMQISDGGWGWFSGVYEQSWPHTTAVVVHGLQIAQQNDVALTPGVLERGVEWLKNYQAAELVKLKNAAGKTNPYKPNADNLDAFVYMVLVDAGHDSVEMRDFLYRDRNQLAVYSKAMFGLALEKLGDAEKLAMILRNIEQYLVQDEENDTAYLKLPADNYWWYWYGSETEANAYYLKLLARTSPKDVKAPRLVKYLLNNRKHATYWSSTRDTAVCVEAFADYLRASGETAPDMVVEIWLDGEKVQEAQITPENLFSFNNAFVLAGEAVKEGKHELEIRRRGQGPVYFNAYLTNFTLEDPIDKAGLEVKVARKYYLLKPVDTTTKVRGDRGQALDQRVEKYERQELKDLATLTSGQMVEIELEIESKNDYEYLIFEDMKPAGFEPVEVRSGYVTTGLPAYMELRDNRVAFFVRSLARGKHSVSYRMRAEIPGKFSALPARAYAMYAPELKGNSREIKLVVED